LTIKLGTGLSVNMKFIYCIASKNKCYIKLGVSINPLERFKGIQTSCPFDLELIHVVFAEPGYGNSTENEIFKELDKLGIWRNREWFKYKDAEKIIKVVNEKQYTRKVISKEKIKRLNKIKEVITWKTPSKIP
jgi:hypothetical protein